jgi:hypothetical protein
MNKQQSPVDVTVDLLKDLEEFQRTASPKKPRKARAPVRPRQAPGASPGTAA